MSAVGSRFLSPVAIARLLGVRASKVFGWIRSGELTAANLATRARARPRFRISSQPLDAILATEIVSAKAIYFIPNLLNPALLARAANRIRPVKDDPTTADHDILSRLYLLIDADAIRPSGISATDAEHEAAIAKAKEIRDW